MKQTETSTPNNFTRIFYCMKWMYVHYFYNVAPYFFWEQKLSIPFLNGKCFLSHVKIDLINVIFFAYPVVGTGGSSSEQVELGRRKKIHKQVLLSVLLARFSFLLLHAILCYMLFWSKYMKKIWFVVAEFLRIFSKEGEKQLSLCVPQLGSVAWVAPGCPFDTISSHSSYYLLPLFQPRCAWLFLEPLKCVPYSRPLHLLLPLAEDFFNPQL